MGSHSDQALRSLLQREGRTAFHYNPSCFSYRRKPCPVFAPYTVDTQLEEGALPGLPGKDRAARAGGQTALRSESFSRLTRVPKTRTSCVKVKYIRRHSTHHRIFFDSPGRALLHPPALLASPRIMSVSVEYHLPRSALAPLDTASQDILEYVPLHNPCRVVLSLICTLLTSRAQEPVLAYRAPSYNYHLPPDLERSARCRLFEDQGNAYATSSSEASPCLATPQTLHPTQTFGNSSSSFFSPLRLSQDTL